MPGDTKTHKARQAKKRRRIRKLGDLTDMRRKLSQAVTSAEDVLLDDQSDAAIRRLSRFRAGYGATRASP